MTLPSSPSLEPDLATEVRRLADRLRTLGPARLSRPHPPYASVAEAALAVAQALADLALGLDDPPSGSIPVPRLTDAAVADQVVVTGHELVRALDRVVADDRAETARDQAVRELRDLRLRL